MSSSFLICLAASISIQQGRKIWEENKNRIFNQIMPGAKHLHASLPGHSAEKRNPGVLRVAEEKTHCILFSA